MTKLVCGGGVNVDPKHLTWVKCRAKVAECPKKTMRTITNSDCIKIDVVRTGECNHCGDCCNFRKLAPYLSDREKKIIEKMWGIPYSELYERMDEDFCKRYDKENKRCMQYELRPSFCQDFPQAPEEIEGLNCGFKFEKLDTGVER